MRTRGSLFAWTLGAIVAVVAIGVAVWVIVAVTGEDSPGTDEGVTVERILEEPAQYLGLEVTVTAEVVEVGDGVFTVGAGLDEDLLVVAPRDGRLPRLEQGQVVRIGGTVRRVEAGEEPLLEDTVRVTGDLAEAHDDDPAVVARSVSTDVGGG